MNNIFLSERWIDFVCSNNPLFKKIKITLKTREIYLAEIKKFIFKYWYIYGELNRIEFEELINIAKENKVDLVESSFNLSRWQLSKIEGLVDIKWEFGTYVTDLTLDEDTLWSNLHKKHRNDIRKAIKDGVKIKYDITSDSLVEIMRETYGKTRYNQDYFENLKKYLKDDMIIASAHFKDNPVAVILIPYNLDNAYYFIGGSTKKGHSGASNLLQWEIIKKLKKMGVKKYDFGGARKQTDDQRLRGIFRFKERFGGDFVECYYWVKRISTVRSFILIQLRKMYTFLRYGKYELYR